MMNKESDKKKWIRPELTVLVRNKPEEAVLSTCHQTNQPPGSTGGPDRNSVNNACYELKQGTCQIPCEFLNVS